MGSKLLLFSLFIHSFQTTLVSNLKQHFFHLDSSFRRSSNISNWLSRIPTQSSLVNSELLFFITIQYTITLVYSEVIADIQCYTSESYHHFLSTENNITIFPTTMSAYIVNLIRSATTVYTLSYSKHPISYFMEILIIGICNWDKNILPTFVLAVFCLT